ncbi:MAG: hypothetical protein GX092_07030 [Clostridia bacterium]|nr:hypothetical protein [Clostridia bacterium]
MACLQFRYDGYKRSNRNRGMCFFPQRFPYQNQCYCVPRNYPQPVIQTERTADEKAKDKEVDNTEEFIKPDVIMESQDEEIQTSDNTLNIDNFIDNSSTFSEKTTIVGNENVCPIKESSPIASDQSNEEASQKETKQKGKPDFSRISEIFINKLSTTETSLSEIKMMVETGKPFLDDLLYKLESFMQIIEVVKANERRRFDKPQAQVTSLKTTKDSCDEFLELLQGPVFQNVLRQFLISIMVRDDDVTKFRHSS